MATNNVIVIGGGLAGVSAAHTVLEHGGTVVLVDKSAFLGGNSTKATSGINGTYTQAQADAGVKDSPKQFEEDTNTSFHGGKAGQPVNPLVRVLTRNSGEAVQWLTDKFALDLSIVGYMGGHSARRCHRGKERFPGMTITYALIEALEKVEKESNGKKARILTKSRVTRLVRDGTGAVVGAVYEDASGQEHELRGAVIVCSGGFGADFGKDSLLSKHRPDLMHLSTTNGDHCTGDGMKIAEAVGSALTDMERVQVHPTGLVNPAEPDAKIKFLAAEAMRGTGALIINRDGERFCNELGRRDYVSGCMFKNKGPFRLFLNSACAKEIHWHCKHYTGRGLMKHFKSGADVAKEMGISPDKLQQTFAHYNECAKTGKEPHGKVVFRNAPWDIKDEFYIAQITPLIHYCMGGIKVNEFAEAIDPKGNVIDGLYAAGEVAGGVHGINRLGGNSLMDCVVYGRVAGRQACASLLRRYCGEGANSRVGVLASQIAPAAVPPQQQAAAPAAAQQQQAAAPAAPAPAKAALKTFTKDDIAKHNKENDCWVIVGDQVLDVTKFLPDHPGGKKAILLFAGRDATEEFDMIHKREVIEKYAPDAIIGKLAA